MTNDWKYWAREEEDIDIEKGVGRERMRQKAAEAEVTRLAKQKWLRRMKRRKGKKTV